MKLLMIGCRFPSWLVRFFLRAARRSRFSVSTERTDFVVDPTATDDAALVQFLRTFKTNTEIFTQYTPAEFVDELSDRWNRRLAAAGQVPPASCRPHCVFISYANEDAAAAARIAQQLAACALPAWLDRQEIRAGDEWERKMHRNIDTAAVFVPILSRSCANATGHREFRQEWRHAIRLRDGLVEDERLSFIYPLVIDDLPRGSTSIDQELRALHWEPLGPDRTLSAEFTERLRQAYRRKQMRSLRG